MHYWDIGTSIDSFHTQPELVVSPEARCPLLHILLFDWVHGFGSMSLHWLQGMPFWASWLPGYLVCCLLLLLPVVNNLSGPIEVGWPKQYALVGEKSIRLGYYWQPVLMIWTQVESTID
jgi:hypothetical protein